ncbi:hypothetical protein [Priestia aryabhattai]
MKRLSVIIGEFGIAVIEYFTVADYSIYIMVETWLKNQAANMVIRSNNL